MSGPPGRGGGGPQCASHGVDEGPGARARESQAPYGKGPPPSPNDPPATNVRDIKYRPMVQKPSRMLRATRNNGLAAESCLSDHGPPPAQQLQQCVGTCGEGVGARDRART